MKRDKKLRFAPGCLLAGLLLLAPGCSVRKERKESAYRQEATFRLQTDSLLSTGRQESVGESFRQWEMVRLSPPDSTGRQHVSAIVRSHEIRHNRTATESSLHRHTADSVRQTEEHRSDSRTTDCRSSSPIRKWLVGFLFAAGLIVLRLWKKR